MMIFFYISLHLSTFFFISLHCSAFLYISLHFTFFFWQFDGAYRCPMNAIFEFCVANHFDNLQSVI